MTAFLVRRAVRGVVVLLLVSAVVFGLGLLAGDPVKLLIPAETTPEQLEALRQAYGLNDPAPVRFVRFVGGMVHGDFGYSFRFQQPALSIVLERLGTTVQLAAAAMALTLVVALPAGIISALKKDSWLDTLIITLSVVGHSIPSFVFGLVLIYVLAVSLALLPTSGYGSPAHLVMPALTLGLFYTGRVARLMRSSTLDVLHEDYMRTARAKGLAEQTVVLRHGLKNAALPV